MAIHDPDPVFDASDTDMETVARQLGHRPRGPFRVVVRDADGSPVVIQNAPYLFDGTPMPTLYWLTGPDAIRAVGRLESAGGVDRAELEIGEVLLEATHARYAADRSAFIRPDETRPLPAGGVAGTRRGVKCLHAHYAYHLAGGDDPVGRWVQAQLEAKRIGGRDA